VEAARVVERIGTLLAASGTAVGLVANRNLAVAGLPLGAHSSNHQAARMALNHPMVELAVLETPAAEISEFGLPFDVCDLAVITTSSSAGPEGFLTPEALLGRVARRQIVRAPLVVDGASQRALDEAVAAVAGDAAAAVFANYA
jgi:hypothetical protein